MKIDTPIHLLENYGQLIAKVGKFLRKTRLVDNVIIGQNLRKLVNSMVSQVSPISFYDGCNPHYSESYNLCISR
jgi:hypothetical protein